MCSKMHFNGTCMHELTVVGSQSSRKEGENASSDNGVIKWLAVLAGTLLCWDVSPLKIISTKHQVSCTNNMPIPITQVLYIVFAKKILSKEYINFLNFFQMYFTGVVLTVMLQVFQLTQLLQVTLVPTARCASQSHLSLLENKGIRSLRLSQSRKVILVPKGRQ